MTRWLVAAAAFSVVLSAASCTPADRQFMGQFRWSSWSSYQVYLWAKEANQVVLEWPNSDRIARVLAEIDATGMSGVGGGGVCHYGCQ